MAAPTTDAVQALLAAAKEPDDDTLGALRPHLADDVKGIGLFVAAAGAAEFIEALRTPAAPVMAFAEYDDGTTDESGSTLVVGTLPPGLPISAVHLTVRGDDEGRIVELLQEIVEAKPEAQVGIQLDEAISQFVNSAFDRQAPLVVAYVDGDGAPHVSFRGTVQTHGPDALGLWLRDPDGGLATAIDANPRVALIGSDQASRAHYVFEGRARKVADPEESAAIYERSPDHERNVDAGRRGVAVVIDLDVVKGGALGSMTYQTRS